MTESRRRSDSSEAGCLACTLPSNWRPRTRRHPGQVLAGIRQIGGALGHQSVTWERHYHVIAPGDDARLPWCGSSV